MGSITGCTFYITGFTKEGKKFRPSDWVERLCGALAEASREDVMAGRHGYSNYVRPEMQDKNKVVFVDGQLSSINPLSYNFLHQFAEDNNLEVIYCNPKDA